MSSQVLDGITQTSTATLRIMQNQLGSHSLVI